MSDIFFLGIILSSMIYEYHRRETIHKETIRRLKENLPLSEQRSPRDLGTLILSAVIAIVFGGFVIFLAFFFPVPVKIYLLIAPIGIEATLIMIVKRDVVSYIRREGSKL